MFWGTQSNTIFGGKADVYLRQGFTSSKPPYPKYYETKGDVILSSRSFQPGSPGSHSDHNLADVHREKPARLLDPSSFQIFAPVLQDGQMQCWFLFIQKRPYARHKPNPHPKTNLKNCLLVCLFFCNLYSCCYLSSTSLVILPRNRGF